MVGLFQMAFRGAGFVSLIFVLSAFHGHEIEKRKPYTLDRDHVNIVWSVDHFGFSKVMGKFTAVQGELQIDEAHPENASATMKIDMNGISSGVPALDDHLKSADFFDVAKYPVAEFSLDSVVLTGVGKAKVMGTLNLHGVSKPVELKATHNKTGLNPVSGKSVMGFSAQAKIKRSDFGINYALPGVSDEVQLIIEAEFIADKE